MIKFLKIFGLGFLFLIFAVIINVLGHYLGFLSWYDFILNFNNISLRVIDFIYLFFIYPLFLGFGSYYLYEFIFG